MKRILLALLVVHASACLASAQLINQWELRKKTASGMQTYGLISEDNKAIGFLGGVPAMLTIGGTPAWADITGKPSTFPPEAHNQAISTITGLQDALDAKASTASLADYLTTATAASTYLPLTGGTLTGSLTGTSFISAGTFFPTRTISITGGQSLTWNDTNGTGFYVTVRPDSPSANQIVNFNPNGNIVTTADTGRVTSTMILDGTLATADLADGAITNAKLAGSIALSKLAITGTPDGTKYLRDDGSWQSISLSGYLPLTGGTLTGPLAITGGTVTSSANPLAITQTWNGAGIAFQGPRITITDTQSSITEQFFGLYAGASGTTKLFAVEKIGGANVVEVPSIRSTSSTWSLDFSELGLALGSARRLSWASTVNYYDSKDLIISRDAAAKLKLGLDSATPVSQQILTAHASGTNIAASNLTIGGSLSTGTGAGGDVIEVTSMSGSSGSSANATQTRRQSIGRFINLNEGTATNVVSIALPSGKVTGGTATLTVWASDGTDHQALTSEIRFSAVNKAGTITATTSQTDGTTAASAGTLTVTYDATASGNNLLLRANATSSLTQTILRTRLVITALNGDDVQTVTPQ